MVEKVITDNVYNNKWFLINKTVHRGSLFLQYTYAYDNYGNIVHETGPLGQDTTYSYLSGDYISRRNFMFMPSLLSKQITINNGQYQTVEYIYDTQAELGLVGNVNEIHRDLGLVQKIKYNQYGDVIWQQDENGNITGIGYDYGTGGKINISTTRYVTNYDETGGTIGESEVTTKQVFNFNSYYLIKEIDPKGNKTEYVNDQLGRVREVRFSDNTTLSYRYNDKPDDLYVIVEDERQKRINGSHLKYEYDGLGRLKALEQYIGATEFEDNQARKYRSENFYNADGTLKKVKDSQGRETHLYYDTYSRLRKIIYPDNTKLETSYDYNLLDNEYPQHYKQEVVDANTNRTIYYFDKLGRLKLVIEDPDEYGAKTRYEYDTLGNLLNFKDAKGRQTGYQYDLLNRLIKETYSDNSTYEYKYDNLGNITNKKDGNGNNIRYKYDSLNRLVKIEYSDTEEVRYGYDLNNNRTFVVSPKCTGRYEYNNRNWLTNEQKKYILKSEVISKEIRYRYNEVGDLTNQIYPSGARVNYKVNTLHRTKEILLNPYHLPLTTYEYNPMGTIKQIEFGNGVKQGFTYDLRDRALLTKAMGSGRIIFKQKLGYDAVGNRLSDEDENGFKTSYKYDKLYRLKQIIYPGKIPNKEGDTYFLYDAVGNRTKMIGRYMEHEYSYKPKLNQLTHLRINKTGGISYSYDLNGNLTNEIHYRGNLNHGEVVKRVNLEWDAENRLKAIRYPHIDQGNIKGEEEIVGNGLEFKYDADGNRIYKASYYSNINHRNNKKETIYMRDSSGTVIEEYITERISPILPITRITNIYVGGILRIQKKHKGVIKGEQTSNS